MGRIFQLLILIGLAAIVWRLVRRALEPGPSAQGGGEAPKEAPKFEPTARCSRCGTFVPSAQLDADGLCPRCRA